MTYRVLLSIIFLIVIIRVQLKTKPYRVEPNNSIEVTAITAGLITLYAGILFQEDEEGDFDWVVTLAFIVLILINVIFIIEWSYLALVSLNSKREIVLALLTIYRFLLCKRNEDALQKFSGNEYDEQSSPNFQQNSRYRKVLVKELVRKKKSTSRTKCSNLVQKQKLSKRQFGLSANDSSYLHIEDASKKYIDSSVSERCSEKRLNEECNNRENDLSSFIASPRNLRQNFNGLRISNEE